MKNKRMMRKMRILSTVLIVMTLMCGGCGKNKVPEGENIPQEEENASVGDKITEESVAEETEEVIKEMSVEVSEETEEEFTREDGILLLTSSVNNVIVHIPDNQEAEDAINAFFTEREHAYEDTVKEYCDMAREDLTWREEEGLEDGWNGYGLGRTYSVARADISMISILEESYEYTGGAHPNATRVAYNFDAKTGKRLALADVASDFDEIRTESVRYLGEMLPESEYADMLFEDYANYLEDILTDATWYTDEDGFHIICNEYIITPHAAGILDFLLPYDEVDVVTKKYIPAEDVTKENKLMDDQTE